MVEEPTCDTRVKEGYMNEPRPHLNENDVDDKMAKYMNFMVKRALLSNSMLDDLLRILLGCMWVMKKHAEKTYIGLWE